MNVRELLSDLSRHAADGRALDDEVLIRINGDVCPISDSYANGTFILIAGTPIENT